MTQGGKNLYSQLDTLEIEEIVRDAQSEDWDKVSCVFCGKKVSINDALNFGGDPVCRRCA